MEIEINGNVYIHFIRSVFNANKKIGIEFIIDVKKSDICIINGLKRLNLLSNNKFSILNNNYPRDINLITTKYLSKIELNIIESTIKIKSLNIINIDKPQLIQKELNKSIYINKYATGKNKIVNDIMEILKQNENEYQKN